MADDIQKLILTEMQELKKSVKATEKCVNNMKTDFKLHQQEMKYEMKEMRETNKEHKEILEEHKQTGKALRDNTALRLKQQDEKVFGKKGLESRVKKLEQPGKWLNTSWKMLLGAGTVAGIAYFIIKILTLLPLL